MVQETTIKKHKDIQPGNEQQEASSFSDNCNEPGVLKPAYRKLRGYAFDPSLSLSMDTCVINDIIYKVVWENVQPGPIGEYLEVVDYDPPSRCFYKPVNLDDRYILAQDGIAPDESNPQFHQQMVYAVAMTTIKHFELALGRKISWSAHRKYENDSEHSEGTKRKVEDEYIPRLRIYPHALREANAYYSPLKKAVLFGYFNAMPSSPNRILPGGIIYTCLSHDIIAHEVTHALLDGMHRRYIEATHRDSLAFHEAFADIVALFQHFSFPDVLKAQIAETRGDLASQNMLGKLAQEFGQAIGHYGSLRDALGHINEETKKWEPLQPDRGAYLTLTEPHARGSILVAAVFDAFINIYRSRVADLLRIATGGTGVLPAGALAPDLVNRMATEASKSASHVLRMCIRALDYCPPANINFGDYLRAIITADYDLVADDERNYRLAFIEAFQKRGIYPDNIKNMSVESLLCKIDIQESDLFGKQILDFFKKFKETLSYVSDREMIYNITQDYKEALHTILIASIRSEAEEMRNNTNNAKAGNANDNVQARQERYKYLGLKLELENREQIKQFGLKGSRLKNCIIDDVVNEMNQGNLTLDSIKQIFSKYEESPGEQVKSVGIPRVEVHNLRLISRTGPHGNVINQILVTLTQKAGVVCDISDRANPNFIGHFVPGEINEPWFEKKDEDFVLRKALLDQANNKDSKRPDFGETQDEDHKRELGWFIFRTGCTVIFDLDNPVSECKPRLKYIIRKDFSETRIQNQCRIMFGNDDFSLNATYFGAAHENLGAEPFAMIHKIL